jgi:hypothetical protein
VLPREATHGVPIALVERSQAPRRSPLLKSSEAASITALDHVVVRSPNPSGRSRSMPAARTRPRLDRSNPDWGSRLLFFRCGDLVVEIAHDLKKGVSDAPDQLWGLSWRAPDIAGANQRLRRRASRSPSRATAAGPARRSSPCKAIPPTCRPS